MPPAASHLCSMLPPPNCFHGPFVMADPLMELIKHLNLNETGKRLDRSPNTSLSKHWFFRCPLGQYSGELETVRHRPERSLGPERRGSRPGDQEAGHGRGVGRGGCGTCHRTSRRPPSQRHLPEASAEASEIRMVYWTNARNTEKNNRFR